MYEWRSHTAEVELFVRAESEEAVFADALDAFGRLIELEAGGEPARHALALEGRDPAALLVEWLEELIYLADTDSFVPDGAERLELSAAGLRAEVVGRRAAFDPLVKAATYHDVRFERTNDGSWEAKIVLDV